MIEQFLTGSDVLVEVPAAPTHEELLVKKRSWERLQDIWDCLYCFVDFHRDALEGDFECMHTESYSRATKEYVKSRFQEYENDVQELRKELLPEELPFMEEHLDMVSEAIKEHKEKFCSVVSAIDNFAQIDEKKWEKRMPQSMQYKRFDWVAWFSQKQEKDLEESLKQRQRIN
jgi:hypothetical protein